MKFWSRVHFWIQQKKIRDLIFRIHQEIFAPEFISQFSRRFYFGIQQKNISRVRFQNSSFFLTPNFIYKFSWKFWPRVHFRIQQKKIILKFVSEFSKKNIRAHFIIQREFLIKSSIQNFFQIFFFNSAENSNSKFILTSSTKVLSRVNFRIQQ